VSFLLPRLRRKWDRIAPDLADVDQYDWMDFDKIVKKLTRFYFRDVKPDKAPIHNFANVYVK
jgi:hypothetical protein